MAGRARKDELEAAWWQEHAELALGPSAASHAPSGGSPTKAGAGGAEGNMTRKVGYERPNTWLSEVGRDEVIVGTGMT